MPRSCSLCRVTDLNPPPTHLCTERCRVIVIRRNFIRKRLENSHLQPLTQPCHISQLNVGCGKLLWWISLAFLLVSFHTLHKLNNCRAPPMGGSPSALLLFCCDKASQQLLTITRTNTTACVPVVRWYSGKRFKRSYATSGRSRLHANPSLVAGLRCSADFPFNVILCSLRVSGNAVSSSSRALIDEYNGICLQTLDTSID